MFWGGGRRSDPVKKLEAICRDTGDVRSLNKWVAKHKDLDLSTLRLGNKHPLHLACSKGFVELATNMVQIHGVKADVLDETNKCNALHYAASGGSAPTVEFLVERCDLNVSAVAENGYTPIHFACREGHWRIVHYILACGALYEYSRVDGCTGLMLCAQVGHIETVKYLVERNICNINEVDFGGNTALHFAAVEGHTDIVRYLLTCPGINPTLRNAEGLTAVEICPVSALIALIHRLSHNVDPSARGAAPAPFVLSPPPQKRISFQKRPFVDDTISELSTDPFESAEFDKRRPSTMSQRMSGISTAAMSASSLLAEEMLIAEQQFDTTVSKITRLISEFAGLPLKSHEKEVDLMLTWAVDRVNTVSEYESHSNIMAEVIRRRSYRLSVRSSIGLSLDAKALRDLLLTKSPSPSSSPPGSSFPPTPVSSRPSPQPSPLNQTATRGGKGFFFPESPKNAPGRTPPPLLTQGDNTLYEVTGEDFDSESGSTKVLSPVRPEEDVDNSRLITSDLQSMRKITKPVTEELVSNSDSEAANMQSSPAMDPYICGEEARLLWPGTHTPVVSPIISDAEEEDPPTVRERRLSSAAEMIEINESILPPPFPTSAEFADASSGNVVADHEGLPVLPWGSGDPRQSPRLSPRTSFSRSPRSISPRLEVEDITRFLASDAPDSFRNAVTSSTRRPSLKVAPVMSGGKEADNDSIDAPQHGNSGRRPSLKVAPILSPVARSADSPEGEVALQEVENSIRVLENDSDSEDIILVRSSPRSNWRGSPRSSPRLSVSTDNSALSPVRSLKVPEASMASLRHVSDDNIVVPRGVGESPGGEPAADETPLQQMHRKAVAMVANSRSSDRRLINFKDLHDSGTKSISSPINATPSNRHSANFADVDVGDTVKALFGAADGGSSLTEKTEVTGEATEVFTPSQWEYLSSLLGKAVVEETGQTASTENSPLAVGETNSMGSQPVSNNQKANVEELAVEIARVKQQETVIKAGHKLAAKILFKYTQRAHFDSNIDVIANAWGCLLRNAKRPKLVGDEEDVDEWTLRYKRFTQSRHGAGLGLGLRISVGKPQNYAQKPEPTRSVSVDRGLRRSQSNDSVTVSDSRTKRRGSKSPSITPVDTPRTLDDTDVTSQQKTSFKKTFLAPLWIPPPELELDAPVIPPSASSGKRGKSTFDGFGRSPRAGGTPRQPGSPRAFSFGESPRGEKRNSFNENNNALSPPDTLSPIKSLRNPIKQEEEELRRQLLMHHQLHSQISSGSMLGDEDDVSETVSGISTVVPPPLDWSQIDLKTLGMMPDQVVPTFKANEAVLWRLFCAYVLSQDGLTAATRSIAQSSKGRRLSQVMMSRRMLGFGPLWTMLRDFEVCPTQCSKKLLLDFSKEIMETSSSRSGGGSGSFDLGDDDDRSNTTATLVLKRPWDEKKNKICFVDFKKILWRLARDCVKSSAYAHPSMRLCKLFRLMDSGQGRAKLSRSSRSSTLLPAFVLFEASTVGVPSNAFSPPSSGEGKGKGRLSWPARTPDNSPLSGAKLFASLRADRSASVSSIETPDGMSPDFGRDNMPVDQSPLVSKRKTAPAVSDDPSRIASPARGRMSNSRETAKGLQSAAKK